MTAYSNNSWIAMSDKALVERIGSFIKNQRLTQDKTQDELAKAAGISRSTLSLLERGEPVTLATLIQVLRVLDQLNFMQSFIVDEIISPLALVKLQKQEKQRARAKKEDQGKENDW